MDDVHLDDLDMEAVEDDEDSKGADNNGEDEAPIVRFINKMLLDAIKPGGLGYPF